MISNIFLLIFAIAFMGCVLATPLVSRLAGWLGAIDRPDQFRRIHKGAIPRMGGLGLAFGLGLSLLPVVFGNFLRDWPGFEEWWPRQGAVVVAALIVLVVGALDDTRGLRPRVKLLGQAGAVLVLIAGGIRIKYIGFLGLQIPLSHPIQFEILGRHLAVDLPSTLITLVWFLGCMNIWNLIDGMDGLASGVGLLVSGTLMLVAAHQLNFGSAALAAALAGSLAGFLLYNWHPACIFLGDTGSLLIGLLIGVIGVQDSLKGTTTVSILFPVLAMGLPISDTCMAIFRRWVRDLPFSSADRRHVHHLLIGLGLGPRAAALILYAFTVGLCGVVLLGVAWNNEALALILGGSGCLAFLLILTSRRDELASLWADLRLRMTRKRQEQQAAKITWEAIQRIELCEKPHAIWESLLNASRELGGDGLRMTCLYRGRTFLEYAGEAEVGSGPDEGSAVPTAMFRLPSGRDLVLTVSLHQAAGATLAADIAFRSLQRLALATAQRLEWLLDEADSPAALLDESAVAAEPEVEDEIEAVRSSDRAERRPALDLSGAVGPTPAGWLRSLIGARSATVLPRGLYGDD